MNHWSASDDKIGQLTELLARLPSLGPRSAKRITLHLLSNRTNLMTPLAKIIEECCAEVVDCKICGNIDLISPCNVCSDYKKNDKLICIVESVADLWAMERSGGFDGKYHVLGGNLSIQQGKNPSDLRLEQLIERIKLDFVTEVIIATNPTVDGQTTAHYIIELIKERVLSVKLSRLALGMPLGGELDYLDDGTISVALKSRNYL